MFAKQRYVSKELTHFVGTKKKEDERYPLLLKIIKTGWLSAPPHDPSRSGSMSLMIDFNVELSSNAMYNPNMVCFCDIPINDLHIHIKKYTPFGISFDKSFLIKNGANPMFYISNNSLVHKIGGNDKIKLSEGYDYIRHEFHYILTASANFLKNNIPDITTERVMHLYHFINYYMFSFLKFFDAKKSDDDKDNFYMEREWRILGDLSFSLEDVERIILPRAYGKKIREDLPEYCGQISFVD